jgi:hypothetical protein
VLKIRYIIRGAINNDRKILNKSIRGTVNNQRKNGCHFQKTNFMEITLRAQKQSMRGIIRIRIYNTLTILKN